MTGNPWLLCFQGILWREFLRFLHQRGRFFAALVRPLVWLFIFAAGFRSVLGDAHPGGAQRVILSTGKVFYELEAARPWAHRWAPFSIPSLG